MRSSAASRTAASATTALYNEHTAQGATAKYRRRLTSYDPGMPTFKVDQFIVQQCRDAAKIDQNRRPTLTKLRRVARACQSSLQAWVAIARHSPAKGAAAEAIRVVA